MKILMERMGYISSILKKLSLGLLLLTVVASCTKEKVDDKKEETDNVNATVTFRTDNSVNVRGITGVSLKEAKILVTEMEFENDVEDDGIDDDTLDFETEPFVMELNPTGSNTVVHSTLPLGGTFDEIGIEIEALDDDETGIDPDFEYGGERHSIYITGTYNGTDFTFRSDIAFELELELDPPLFTTASTPVNVDVVVDLSTWFKDAGGQPLDPTDKSNREIIEKNIKNSFQAFDSDDDDGDNDEED